MSRPLTERVVAITGAGRGVGREHALYLAGLGTKVVVNDLGGGTDGDGADVSTAQAVVDEIVAAGGSAVANTANVVDSAGAQSIIDTALDAYGRLDGLVNNAGILRDRTLVNMLDEDWDTSIRVNLRGAFAPSRAAGIHWRERSKAGEEVDASIVFTSSESGVFGNAGQANYAAAKAGVASLSEVCHKELGRYGVRTNAILPRARTRLTEDIVGQPKDGAFDKWDPANIPPFVAFLLSDASTISGQVFLVGGGKVQRAAPWSLDSDWQLKKDGRWTFDELVSAAAEAGDPNNGARNTGGIR